MERRVRQMDRVRRARENWLVAEILVSAARPDEAEQVADMFEWLLAPPGIRPSAWTRERAVAAIGRVISSDSATILVARLGGEPAGFCTAYDDIESIRFGRRVWVEDLAVDPERRSLGIGKRLLDAAKQWARERGADRVVLESGEARAAAHRFYEREQPSYRALAFGWDL